VIEEPFGRKVPANVEHSRREVITNGAGLTDIVKVPGASECRMRRGALDTEHGEDIEAPQTRVYCVEHFSGSLALTNKEMTIMTRQRAVPGRSGCSNSRGS